MGSPSEGVLGGTAHAFYKYSAQHHKAVCAKLTSWKGTGVLPKLVKSSKFR